ncbi:MAG TPA: hypothetical protein VGN57_18760 [Pirellulaceae bacterium]|jgi:PAS domain-containing protein|nr:hypothetical protein [Pirellulaceae bacterium]
MVTEQHVPPAAALSFQDAVARATALIERWLHDPNDLAELDAFPDGIFVRNLDRMLVLSNAAYRALFPPGQVSAGRSSLMYLSADVKRISERSDNLLLEGLKFLEMEHEFELTPGQMCDLLVYKRLIRGPEHPPYFVGVLRPVGRYETSSPIRPDLKTAARLVSEFDDVDLKICRGICDGATNQALSVELAMTTRAIEMRRQKILSQLGLSQTVELVKLLVRLQDRGYLDLGI